MGKVYYAVDTLSCRTKWIRPPGSLKNEACVVWIIPAVATAQNEYTNTK